MDRALVTGAAGFIGSHLVEELLARGYAVTGIDNFDPFYSPEQKRQTVSRHLNDPNYAFIMSDVRNGEQLKSAISGKYDVIVHLAARAGVRPSIQDPVAYQETNVRGTQNMLDLALHLGSRQFVFASSSSVYGVSKKVPWSEEDNVLLPISPYASTKVSGELLGHVYSHLYGIRFIVLRFFTVFGPRQRPDLAIHKFAKLIQAGLPISVYGDGNSLRDYTYIQDIINGIMQAIRYGGSQYEVFNLGNGKPVRLLNLIETLSGLMQRSPILQYEGEQPGDVPQTWADITKSNKLLGYLPETSLVEGLRQFCKWYTRDLKAGENIHVAHAH